MDFRLIPVNNRKIFLKNNEGGEFMQTLPVNRGFWKVLLFTIITLGIYQLYLIHAFAKETNIACREDGRRTRGLIGYILLSIITLGIYSVIWQALLVDRRGNFCEKHGVPNRLTLLFFLLSYFILGALTLGICVIIAYVKYIHQQNDVNRIYNKSLIQKN